MSSRGQVSTSLLSGTGSSPHPSEECLRALRAERSLKLVKCSTSPSQRASSLLRKSDKRTKSLLPARPAGSCPSRRLTVTCSVTASQVQSLCNSTSSIGAYTEILGMFQLFNMSHSLSPPQMFKLLDCRSCCTVAGLCIQAAAQQVAGANPASAAIEASLASQVAPECNDIRWRLAGPLSSRPLDGRIQPHSRMR